MQFCTFIREKAQHLGLLQADTLIDLYASLPEPYFESMQQLIESGDLGLAAAESLLQHPEQCVRHPIDSYQWTAPLLPSTVLCAGSNYRAHNAEKANAPLSGKEPEFFLKTADCVIGPGWNCLRRKAHQKARLRDRTCNCDWPCGTAHPGRRRTKLCVWLYRGQ